MDFLKQNKFWVGLGLLVIAAGVCFGALFFPLSRQNSERLAELQKTTQAISDQSGESSIPDQRWVDRIKKQTKLWQAELDKVRQTLRGEDDLIEQRLRDPNNPEREEPLEFALWKLVYQRAMKNLEREVGELFPLVTTQTPLDQYEEVSNPEAPELSDAEMRFYERDYWIQKYLVDALGAVNKNAQEPVVPVFEWFRFTESPERLLQPAHGKVYEPVAFKIELRATFTNVPVVLRALLQGKLDVYITGLSLRPLGKDKASQAPGGKELPANLCGLTIRGYVLDYIE
ncbi:MAG: hypothetical protein J7M08_05240 [Planctomycetes bacterium]|nr:hypothetical protein [Planctomycetota bacterium]